MDIVTRSEFGWPATKASVAQTNLGMVVHYDGKNQGLAGKSHTACVSYWKGTRNFHIEGNGWLDIGYAYGVCPHGYVFEGRGFNRQQAAEEPTPGKLQGGNSRYVSCTFMSGPAERPTEKQLKAFQDLRSWLMGKGVERTVHGHRDFSQTDCPGDILYGMVKNGSITLPRTQEIDMTISKADAEIIAKAVWQLDFIAAPPDQADIKTNPTWAAQSYLKDNNAQARRLAKQNVQLVAQLAVQSTAIAALTKVVGDQTKAFDATQFLNRLRTEMADAVNDLNLKFIVEENPTEGTPNGS